MLKAVDNDKMVKNSGAGEGTKGRKHLSYLSLGGGASGAKIPYVE